jgi:hypothetical protein
MAEINEPDLTFQEFLLMARGSRECVQEFDRLLHANLSRQGNMLDLAIDDACRRPEVEEALFIAFVKDLYDRLPRP